jgi:YD repeat-containing protein
VVLPDRGHRLRLGQRTEQSRTYTFANQGGVLRPTAVSAPCSLCGTTAQTTAYDASGNKTREVAHDGGVTFYKYNERGQEIERATFAASFNTATTRPALSQAGSVTSTQWHASFNLPRQVAEPGKISAFTYNASSLNTSIVEKTDGVETQRWTMAYNAIGDMTRITDVTGGNLIGRATSYDGNGRMLSGTTDAGIVLRRQYSPRGFVASSSVGNETSTYTQNGVGLTTQVRLPDGQVLQYRYDANHQLTDVQLNGASITPAMLASADYPDTPLKALAARGRVSLALAVEALISPAYAQSGQLLRRVVPIPGRPMPGQPEYDPRWDLVRMEPLSDFDKAALRMAETTARECECKPDGGYDRPTFTMVSFAHVLFSGHLSPRFSGKSYFAPTEKVGQALVDEIMARGEPGRSKDPRRAVVEATLTRPLGPVGYARAANGTFVPTNRVRLVYEREQCDKRFRSRNEVVTVFPI